MKKTCIAWLFLVLTPLTIYAGVCDTTAGISPLKEVTVVDKGSYHYLAAKIGTKIKLDGIEFALLKDRLVSGRLKENLMLANVKFPYDALENTRFYLSPQQNTNEGHNIIVSSGGRHYEISPDDDGRVNLHPGAYLPLPVLLKAGLSIKETATGIEILPHSDSDNEFELLWPFTDTGKYLRFRQHSEAQEVPFPEPKIILTHVSSSSVPELGQIQLELLVQDNSVDLRDIDVNVCINETGATFKFTELNRRSGKIKVTLPEKIEAGVARLTILARAHQKVQWILRSPLEVSSRQIGIGLGLGVVIVTFLAFFLLFGTNPLPKMVISRGRLSLSKTQIVMWTLLVLFSMVFVWYTTGLVIELTEGILVLLGISSVTSIFAEGKDSADYGKTQGQLVNSGTISLKQLVDSPEAEFDILRFQMLGFTLFTWIYVLTSVLNGQGFPVIPQNLYLLMGISSASYVGGKFTRRVGEPLGVHLNVFENSLKEYEIKEIRKAIGLSDLGNIDRSFRSTLKQYQLDHGLIPADGEVNEFLLDYLRNPE